MPLGAVHPNGPPGPLIWERGPPVRIMIMSGPEVGAPKKTTSIPPLLLAFALLMLRRGAAIGAPCEHERHQRAGHADDHCHLVTHGRRTSLPRGRSTAGGC